MSFPLVKTMLEVIFWKCICHRFCFTPLTVSNLVPFSADLNLGNIKIRMLSPVNRLDVPTWGSDISLKTSWHTVQQGQGHCLDEESMTCFSPIQAISLLLVHIGSLKLWGTDTYYRLINSLTFKHPIYVNITMNVKKTQSSWLWISICSSELYFPWWIRALPMHWLLLCFWIISKQPWLIMCYHHLQKRGVIFMCFQNDSTKMFIQEAFCLGDRILGTIF